MQNPLLKWLENISRERIVVDAASIYAECLPNQRILSLSPEEFEAVNMQSVSDFIRDVIHACARQLEQRGVSPGQMVFYCWHDEQAGQLRFSMVSRSHGFLPFRAKLQQVKEIETIVGLWLSSPYLYEIPWNQIESLDTIPGKIKDEDYPKEHVLQIWSTVI